MQEEASEQPTKVGTIYRNQGADGSWLELEVTDFQEGVMFEMKKIGDTHHVRYAFESTDGDQCNLEYMVWVNVGEIHERFSRQNIVKILERLKTVIETTS